MSRWEYCEIEISGVDKRAKRSVVMFSPQGRLVLDETPTIDQGKQQTQFENECAKLIGRILAQGWEPIGFANGSAWAFKRYIP